MFDDKGKVASRGKINEIILEQALETYESNLKKFDNVSLDTKDFDISFVEDLVLRTAQLRLPHLLQK